MLRHDIDCIGGNCFTIRCNLHLHPGLSFDHGVKLAFATGIKMGYDDEGYPALNRHGLEEL